MTPDSNGTAPIHDRRPEAQTWMPQRAGAWLMLGVAVVIIGIIALAGHANPPTREVGPVQSAAQIQSPDRVKEFEARLRAADERGRQQVPVSATPPPMDERRYGSADTAQAAPPPVDPLVEERKRKDYESLFASNVVLSRRPDGDKLVGSTVAPRRQAEEAEPQPMAAPRLEDIAQAVTKAMGGGAAASGTPAPPERPDAAGVAPVKAPGGHTVYEGTVLDTVLTNRIEGSMTGPVNCLLTNPLYAGDLTLVAPAGSRVLGTATKVQSVGESRLAVQFHRLVMPNGRDVKLDAFPAANQIGDLGLKDKVNTHAASTFAAAGAVGLISGFAQFAGGGFSSNRGGVTVIAGGATDSTARVMGQTMEHFLNRLPSITILEGHRVKVFVTKDLNVPAWSEQ